MAAAAGAGSGPGGGIRPVPRRGLAGRLGRSVVTGLLMTASLAVAAASPGIPASAATAPGAGKITLYSDQVFTGPDQMTAGPDGALWFTNTGNNSIGRITTAGQLTNTYPGAGYEPYYIAAGSDGAMWFAHANTSGIGRITTAVTPAITCLMPASGAAGEQVTITGQNLSGATRVAFNGTDAAIISGSATTITARVPAGGEHRAHHRHHPGRHRHQHQRLHRELSQTPWPGGHRLIITTMIIKRWPSHVQPFRAGGR